MAGKLANNLKIDYLSCSICLDQYTDPRRLPCDHIFCRPCLINHVTKTFTTRHFQNYVTCPLCRVEFEGPTENSKAFLPQDWVNNLPTDSLVVTLIQTLKLHEKELPTKYQQTYKCNVHGGRPRDAFCLTHAQLICWKCASKEHKVCTVQSTDKALGQMQSQVDSLRDQVTEKLTIAQELSKNDKVFDDNRSKAVHDLERAKQQFEKVKSSVENQFKLIENELENANSEHVKERKDFYCMVASLLEQKTILEATLENGGATDILHAFDVISKAVREETEQMGKFRTPQRETKLRFVKDSLFEEFISKYSSIGFVDTGVDSLMDGLPGAMNSPTSAVPSTIAHILNRTKEQPTKTRKGKCEKSFTHMQDIDAIMAKEDDCYINGIVSFDGQSVYIIDRENEKVKQFDLEGKLLDVLQLGGPPHDITCLQPNNELAITQPDEKLIAIVSGNGLAHRRYLQTTIPYNGICQVNDETIALSSWSVLCVDIMSIHGHVLYHISRDAHDLKCDLPNLLCKLSNDRIVVTELGSTIMCIKSSHHQPKGAIVQWTHTAPARIYGVCTDDKDAIYACVKERNEIRLICDDGFLSETAILSEEAGINQPMSIYFSNDNLFVADEKKIKVFKAVSS